MIFDTHMHTEFSTDSEMKIEDAIKVAKEKDLGIIITEHYDLDYPVGNDFKCDIPSYFKAYEKYRSDKVLLGIEIGLASSTLSANEQTVKDNRFDYVLGSIHGVDQIDIFTDYIYMGLDEKTFYDRYFEYMIKCIKMYDGFDSLGHIDYIHRYAPFEKPELRVGEYKEALAEVMKVLIDKNKAIELNTRRFGSEASRKALLEVYRLYKDLGGKYVTIGSDAHGIDAIGAYFDEGLKMVKELGLKAVYFERREMKY
ncbi:MAG: histidinol phosphate phosphatase [Cellulosilyticaceae bacterium]